MHCVRLSQWKHFVQCTIAKPSCLPGVLASQASIVAKKNLATTVMGPHQDNSVMYSQSAQTQSKSGRHPYTTHTPIHTRATSITSSQCTPPNYYTCTVSSDGISRTGQTCRRQTSLYQAHSSPGLVTAINTFLHECTKPLQEARH
jgi:hypothetical protein